MPLWLDDTTQGVTTPARIIRFDSLRHQDIRGSGIADYVLNVSVPEELFDQKPVKQPMPGFEFIEMPAVTLPAGTKPH